MRPVALDDDRRDDPFAESFVGYADDRAPRDPWFLVQHALDLGGVHVGATAHDQVAFAVGDHQVARRP